VSPTTQIFDSSHAFRMWSGEDHIYELLKYLRYAFEEIDFCAQLPSVPNIDAVQLYNSNRQQFIENVNECVKESIDGIYETASGNGSKPQQLTFEMPDEETLATVLNEMKNNEASDGFSFLFDRRG